MKLGELWCGIPVRRVVLFVREEARRVFSKFIVVSQPHKRLRTIVLAVLKLYLKYFSRLWWSLERTLKSNI